MAASERPVQSPCQWCGNAVMQPTSGRLLRYCGRSCRQRAYEARTARRRFGEDVESGVVRVPSAERVVERVVRSRYPRTAAGWESALEELRGQLSDGRLASWHAQRLRQAVAGVDAQLQTLASAGPAITTSPARPRVAFVDERLAVEVTAKLGRAGGVLSTSLQRLADDMQGDVVALRSVVLELEYCGLVIARRFGGEVSVDELAVHARFELTLF